MMHQEQQSEDTTKWMQRLVRMRTCQPVLHPPTDVADFCVPLQLATPSSKKELSLTSKTTLVVSFIMKQFVEVSPGCIAGTSERLPLQNPHPVCLRERRPEC